MATPEQPAPIGGVQKPEARTRDARGVYTTKISASVIDDIDQALRAGGSMETAAAFAGVSPATFRSWLVDGRRAEGMPRPQGEEITLKVELVAKVEVAIADFKLSLTGGIFQHGRDSWQAWAWLAERRFPDEFGRRQRIEHGNADGEPFRVAPTPVFDPSKLSAEELDEVIALLEKARPDGMRSLEAGRGSEELRVIEQGG